MLSDINLILSQERGQSEWNSVYLLIVFIITAILIIALIKPMFKNSQEIVKNEPVLKK
jgi:competence protein ComGC